MNISDQVKDQKNLRNRSGSHVAVLEGRYPYSLGASWPLGPQKQKWSSLHATSSHGGTAGVAEMTDLRVQAVLSLTLIPVLISCSVSLSYLVGLGRSWFSYV